MLWMDHRGRLQLGPHPLSETCLWMDSPRLLKPSASNLLGFVSGGGLNYGCFLAIWCLWGCSALYDPLFVHSFITFVPVLVVSNFASQGGSVQKRIIIFELVELKAKTIINPNSCFSAILVSGSTLSTANLSLTSRPKLRMYATGLSFKKTTKTYKQTHTLMDMHTD